MLNANETLNGYILVEYWGKATSAEIFKVAERLTLQTGGKVIARNPSNCPKGMHPCSYEAPNNLPGEDESSFIFDIQANIAQFGDFCDAMRAVGIRVKEGQLGEPEERDFD